MMCTRGLLCTSVFRALCEFGGLCCRLVVGSVGVRGTLISTCVQTRSTNHHYCRYCVSFVVVSLFEKDKACKGLLRRRARKAEQSLVIPQTTNSSWRGGGGVGGNWGRCKCEITHVDSTYIWSPTIHSSAEEEEEEPVLNLLCLLRLLH